MSSREDILARLRKNTRLTFDKPEVHIQGIQYDDPVEQFIHIATTAGGAKLMQLKVGDDINEKIREAYPEAKVISSNVPGVKADRNPDTVAEAQDLDGTDVGVIQGEIGVAENACIWIPQTMKEKAICFISESVCSALRPDAVMTELSSSAAVFTLLAHAAIVNISAAAISAAAADFSFLDTVFFLIIKSSTLKT